MRSRENRMNLRRHVWLTLAVATTLIAFAQPIRGGSEVPFHAAFDTTFTATFGPGPVAHISVTGEGNASHLGRTGARSRLQDVSLVTGGGVASYTLVAANGDSITFDSEFEGTLPPDPVTFNGSYEITGGTGRFAGATGSGALNGTAIFTGPASGFGSFSLDGTISSPGKGK